MTDPTREFLRHTIATVAYRGGKAIRNAPVSFANFKAGESTKTPLQIVSHMGDLYDWALSQANGKEAWNDSPVLSWKEEVDRFFASLKAFDDYLASGEEIHFPIETLFQGPIADSLTHVGQIAMLRRLADSPIKGENYTKASVETGRVGIEQNDPPYEFE